MSDHRGRACAKCGSYLHHEDDCRKCAYCGKRGVGFVCHDCDLPAMPPDDGDLSAWSGELFARQQLSQLAGKRAIAEVRRLRRELESLEGMKVLLDHIAVGRKKFPTNSHLLPALMEEVGELARAFLDEEGPARVSQEALDVACVAIRIYEEGCADFAEPCESCGERAPQQKDRGRGFMRCTACGFPGQ